MTKLLEKAFEEASKLPAKDQDSLACALLEEMTSQRHWDDLFADSPDLLEKLSKKALEEHRAGRTEELNPNKL